MLKKSAIKFAKLNKEENEIYKEFITLNREANSILKKAKETMFYNEYIKLKKQVNSKLNKELKKQFEKIEAVLSRRNVLVEDFKNNTLVKTEYLYKKATEILKEKFGNRIEFEEKRFEDTKYFSGHVGDYTDYNAQKFLIKLDGKMIFCSDTFNLDWGSSENTSQSLYHYESDYPSYFSKTENVRINLPLELQEKMFDYRFMRRWGSVGAISKKQLKEDIFEKYNADKTNFEEKTGLSYDEFNSRMFNQLTKERFYSHIKI